MPRTDNYPDDIRMYDDDPRSPFYEEPDEEELEEEEPDYESIAEARAERFDYNDRDCSYWERH
jgi:hypothetical protein